MGELIRILIVAVGFWALGVGFGWRARGAHKSHPQIVDERKVIMGRVSTSATWRRQGDDAL